jgi:hypothetical protein
MPSIEHEALVNLFRDNPELAPLVLDSLLGIPVPRHASVVPLDATLVHLAPQQFFADLAVELEGEDGTPLLAVVVEVQLAVAEEKRFTWPVYLATVRARRRCPACVLVVAPDAAVAAWASAPIELGPGNEGCNVLVLGPAQVPVVREPDDARAIPELAVMSALAHGNDREIGQEVIGAALAGLGSFDSKTAQLYLHVIWKFLRGTMREALEKAIKEAEARGEVVKPPFMAELEAKWEARGEFRGKAEGKAESLLNVLSARGLAVTESVRERILGCRDLAQLDEWIRRAASAEALGDVFE